MERTFLWVWKTKIGGYNLKKELTAVKNRIKKLKDKKALIDEELEPLFIREEDLMVKVNREKSEMKKENGNEKNEE